MASHHFITILTFGTIIGATVATPTCITYGGKDVVCSAGPQDYVLERHLVSDNNVTTGITLRDCRITQIAYEAFENLFSLKYLDLSMNKISNLKLGVLDEALQVTYLNLSHNLITGFELGLFDQKPNVEVLDLKGNNISVLILGVFDPMKQLRHLDLSSNMLKGRNLDPYIFDECNGLRFLDFSQNDMSEAPGNLLHSLIELDLLNLDKCSLTSVPSFVTVQNVFTLKHLILSTNSIEVIDDQYFKNLVNLEILDLTANKIRSIPENTFKFTKKLKMVLLRYNALKSIPETLFHASTVLNTVDLSHNLIEIIPVNAFRGTKLKNLNVSVNRFTYLQNNFCLELRNSGVLLSKFYFNQNPWQCACLNELLNELKYFEITYNYSKYDGKEPVCVTSEEFVCKRQPEFNKVFYKMYLEERAENVFG